MTAKRSGKEAFTFRDPVTGRQVLQLTNSPLRSVHGYYDLPPWSRTTGRIVFSSLAPGATEGDIYVMERDGSDITWLAHSRAMTANDGAMAQWSADGRTVYYKDREGDQHLIAWVNPETGEKGAFPGDLRMICPTGDWNAWHTNCSYYPDHELLRRREEHGLFLQDLKTGRSKQLASVADCWRINPRRDEIKDWHLYIKHSKWSPDGKRIMFVFTNEIFYAAKYVELPHVKDIYVINADGTGLKYVGPFGNHPIWHPNGREVLSNSPFGDRPGNSLVLTDVDTGERRLATARIGGWGHPSYSPDGRKIVVEFVLGGEGRGAIHAVDVATDTVEHLVQLVVRDHSHVGTHLHPVWSHDSKQLLYASDASGTAQLCVIDV